MSDSGITISAEDRERLAKTKFGEWFDEFFEKKFEEAFEKKQATRRPAASQPSNPQSDQGNHQPAPQRKRSALEMCLTDTFGF